MINFKRLRKKYLYFKYYKLFLQFDCFLFFNNTSTYLKKNILKSKGFENIFIQVQNNLIKKYFKKQCAFKNIFMGDVSVIGLQYNCPEVIILINQIQKVLKQNKGLVFLGGLFKSNVLLKNVKWYYTGPCLNINLFVFLSQINITVGYFLFLLCNFLILKFILLLKYSFIWKFQQILNLKK